MEQNTTSTQLHSDRLQELGNLQESTILIMQDLHDTTNDLQQVIGDNEYAVITVSGEQQAIKAYLNYQPDIVILNNLHPITTAFRVSEQIRRLPEGDWIPILLVADTHDQQIIDRAFAIGITDFIIAPIQPTIFRKRTRHWLGVTLAEQELIRRNYILSQINKVFALTSGSLDLDEVLKGVIQVIAEAVDCTSAYLCDYNPENATATVLIDYIAPNASPTEQVSDVGSSFPIADFPALADWIASAEPGSYFTYDAGETEVTNESRDSDAKSSIIVAGYDFGQVALYIEIWESRYKREFTEQEVQLIQEIANHISSSIRNAQRFTQIQQSETDLRNYAIQLEQYTDQLEAERQAIQEEARRRQLAEAALYESNARLRALLAHTNVMLHVVDTAGNFTLSKGRALRLLGKSEDELVGQSIREFPEIAAELRTVLSGETFHSTAEMNHVIFQHTYIPLRDQENEVAGAMIVSTDVTEKMQVEKARQRAELLRIKVQEYENTQAIKSRFSSLVSNEFRTPLSTIKLTADLLENYGDRMDEQKRHVKYNQIHEQIDYMTALLEEIITLVELEDTPAPQPMASLNLVPFCREIFMHFRRSDNDDHLMVFQTHSDRLDAETDPNLVEQIVSNLLSYAIENTPRDSVIRLNIFSRGGDVILQLKNSDYQLTDPQLRQLQGAIHTPSGNDSSSGIGLGLAIVGKAVSLLKGTVDVARDASGDTSITIQIPGIAHYTRRLL